MALVQPHHPDQLLLPELRALEPVHVRIRHRGRGGEGGVRRVGADEEERGGRGEWWCWRAGLGAETEAAGYVRCGGGGGARWRRRRGGRGRRRGRKIQIGMQNRETAGAICVLGMKIFLLHPQ
jgi:hypothetical protein